MLRAFLSSLSIVMIGVACAFLTHLTLAKILPTAEYGIFSFIYSVSLLLSVFSLFGFQNSVVRFIPSFENNYFKIKKLIYFSRKVTISLAILSSIVCFIALNIFGFEDEYPFETLLLSVIMVPLMVSMRLHASYMRGFNKSMISVLYETSLREILLLSFVGIALIFGFQIKTGFEALVLLVLALGIVVIVSWLHTRRMLRNDEAEKITTFETKEWIKISLPMMFTIFAQRLLRRSDIIILGLMTHPALVGAYAIAAQFSDVGSIGQKGVCAVFGARAASLYQSESMDELKKLYSNMQIYGAVSAGVISLMIAFLAPTILEFFGDDYSAGYNALLILLCGQFINVCFGPVGVLMIMTKFEKTTMKLTFMAAIGNVICNPVAIYFYGIEGAAVVTVFFLVTRATLSYIFVKRQKLI